MGHLIAADATGSDGLRVITLSAQPDAAFLVPSSIESGFTFRAQTFGVRARCTSLNERCQTATPLGDIGSCANVGLPMIPTADSLARLGESPSSYVFGLIGNTTVVGGGSIADRGYGLLTTNPARVVLQLRWSSGMNTLTPQPNPAVSVFPVPEIAVYASCELEVFNGMLEYLDGTYTLVREVPSDAGFTSMVWSPLIWVSQGEPTLGLMLILFYLSPWKANGNTTPSPKRATTGNGCLQHSGSHDRPQPRTLTTYPSHRRRAIQACSSREHATDSVSTAQQIPLGAGCDVHDRSPPVRRHRYRRFHDVGTRCIIRRHCAC
jgi:hypothetical protein